MKNGLMTELIFIGKNMNKFFGIFVVLTFCLNASGLEKIAAEQLSAAESILVTSSKVDQGALKGNLIQTYDRLRKEINHLSVLLLDANFADAAQLTTLKRRNLLSGKKEKIKRQLYELENREQALEQNEANLRKLQKQIVKQLNKRAPSFNTYMLKDLYRKETKQMRKILYLRGNKESKELEDINEKIKLQKANLTGLNRLYRDTDITIYPYPVNRNKIVGAATKAQEQIYQLNAKRDELVKSKFEQYRCTNPVTILDATLEKFDDALLQKRVSLKFAYVSEITEQQMAEISRLFPNLQFICFFDDGQQFKDGDICKVGNLTWKLKHFGRQHWKLVLEDQRTPVASSSAESDAADLRP